MSSTSASATGRALARLGMLTGRRTPVAKTSPHESRDKVLALVEAAPAPLLIDDICSDTGLHPNTVRGHLDTLVAVGKVQRSRGPSVGRGRPPWLYSAVSASAVAELNAALRDRLQQADADALAQEAAATWAGAAHLQTAVESPDEAVQAAAEALDELGFAAEASVVGDAIVLQACPYASLIADNPVICDIHGQLLAEILVRTEQGVTVASLDVWARPGVCVAHLNRPDLAPARVIAGESPAAVAAAKKPAPKKAAAPKKPAASKKAAAPTKRKKTT